MVVPARELKARSSNNLHMTFQLIAKRRLHVRQSTILEVSNPTMDQESKNCQRLLSEDPEKFA
jgi:hypothetical protein